MWRRCRSTGGLLCAVLFFCSGFLMQARAQTGFISIDCGSEVTYTDSLGIEWSTDGEYISTGENAVVDMTNAKLGPDGEQDGPKLQTLRYFPGPASKNCYTPKVASQEKLLVRLTFLGGNFTSGLAGAAAAAFSVSLGNAYWQDIRVTDPWTPIVREATIVPLQSQLPICFQRGSSGSPFVNSIEIRPLPLISYQLTLSTVLYTNIFRLNCGLESGSPSTRYPEDPLDRIWAADPGNFSIPAFRNESATVNDIGVTGMDNDPPLAVLRSAWNASRISFSWPLPTLDSAGFLYVVLYFAEIGGLKRTDVRELDVFFDGTPLVDPFRLNASVYQPWSFRAPNSSFANMTIVPSGNSTLPALLNAAELYHVQVFNTSLATPAADLTAIEAIKEHFNLTQWQGEPCLVWPYDWLKCSDPTGTGETAVDIIQLNLSGFNLTGPVPGEIGNLFELQELALDNNNLTGNIPDFSNLSKLQTLRLQNNKLSGPIPEFLGALPLTFLTLDNNLFEGEVPSGLQAMIDSGVLTFSAANNPYLCSGGNLCLQPPSSAPSSPPESDDKNSLSTGAIIGAVAGGMVMLLLLGLLLLNCKCFRKRTPKPEAPAVAVAVTVRGGAAAARIVNPSQLKSFSWAEVTAATRNFCKLLGKGGYGDVYYGELPDRQKVAVKVNRGNTIHGQDQFFNEVSLLSRVHHRHLVTFVGYCYEGNHEVLLYEYMAQGKLEGHLRGARNTNSHPLDWKTRLDIVLNASKGLEYLHNSCNPPIIHRDIKTANILLNQHLVAKVSDFGISKPTRDEDRTRGVTTDVKGTFGYLDPEYFREHRLTQKSDVYSFGVVLLEVVTGKPPTTAEFPNSRASNLLEWVQANIRDGNIEAIMDPAISPNYNAETVWKVIELALWCLQPNLSDRPDMARVLQELTGAMELENRQTTVNVTYASPSNLPASAYDQYQRIQEIPRSASRASRGDSSRSSQESIATFSTANITGR